jgi:hypothetical protein
MTEEIFRVIADYENYKISNIGNVLNFKSGKLLKNRINKDGYFYVSLSKNSIKTNYSIHRLVAIAFLDNPENKLFVDHIDNDKKNNNIINLRFATKSENGMNRCLNANNTSGIKGVVFHKGTKKYYARITIDGITRHLGSFKTIEEATQARLNAVNYIFKDFTNLCEKIVINDDIQ